MSIDNNNITFTNTVPINSILSTGTVMSTKLSSAAVGPLTVFVPIEEQAAMYKFEVGDLVICTDSNSPSAGKVGSIMSRQLVLDCDRNGQEISNIRIAATYDVNFESAKKVKDPSAGLVFTSSWYVSYPTVKECHLELAFNKC